MSSRQKHVRKSTRRSARERSRRLVMESLEARLSPAVYLVPADGSLPSVITLADNNSDAKNTIDLSPGSYAGGLVIDGERGQRRCRSSVRQCQHNIIDVRTIHARKGTPWYFVHHK